jgi:16S rRNA (cytosine967-C5)-methyltransferase
VTPGARIQAVVELLDRLDRPARSTGEVAADALLNAYFRDRRYIGAGDRRAIGDAVFQTLRQRGQIDDWIAHDGGLAPGNLLRALRTFSVHHGMGAADLVAACDGGRHRPRRLSEAERRAVALLDRWSDRVPERLADQASFPAWLTDEIVRRFGDAAWAEMIAMTQPAPVDLRVNTLKTTREKCLAALAASGLEPAPTKLSPLGIRLGRRAALPALPAFKAGWFEPQDESSQLAALLVGARPGMRVLDLGAGAGGKSLALAAAMGNRGLIVAADSDAARLSRMTQRLKRAGVSIVRRRAVDPRAKRPAAFGAFDRVLVDAPCSGSGTWRRRPETKWRLTPGALARLVETQDRLLGQAAANVAPGGRLVYATCSILPRENDDRVAAFLDSDRRFRPVPLARAWAEGVGAGAPPGPGPWLALAPHANGTDGFFAAVLERAA